MDKLEKTIMDVASQAFREMESFNDGKINSREDFFSRFDVIQGYTYLAHISDSGLSEASILKLIDIENKSNQLLQNELPRSTSFATKD